MKKWLFLAHDQSKSNARLGQGPKNHAICLPEFLRCKHFRHIFRISRFWRPLYRSAITRCALVLKRILSPCYNGAHSTIPADYPAMTQSSTLSHLDWLEAEAIHIMREVAGQCSNPVLLFSGGKDSICMLRIAEKAFRPGKFPFPLMHIDTGHNYREVIAFRDKRAAELGERLIVRSVEDSMKRGTVVLKHEGESRNKHQSVTLLEAIEEFGFDACIGGARRDEEKARAKERIFSFRDAFGQWDPKNQRPELWDLYNTRVNKGESIRVFPLSNWTEMDVWQYIEREQLELPSIYFAHTREDVRRGNGIVPITELTPAKPGEEII